MGQPAAKQGDRIMATDTHVVMLPSPGGPVATSLPNPFDGLIDTGLSTDVTIDKLPAAMLGSGASNQPPHIPAGGPFQVPPSNTATIVSGSATVTINKKPAARMGDKAMTCNDPAPLPIGTIVARSTVAIGG